MDEAAAQETSMEKSGVDETAAFEAERPRLLRIAGGVLGDSHEAQDVVQQAWLRLHGSDAAIDNLPAWLTTVTTRLCLDRLRARTPVPMAEPELRGAVDPAADVADDVALAETVGVALHVVLDRLAPAERVAFVLHDTLGIDFPTIAAILETTPVAARKLASRARAKVSPSTSPSPREGRRADWQIVDAFLAAAREGRYEQLLLLLAPTVIVDADAAAVALGTPQRIEGRERVATFFNGSAAAALPVFVAERPGAAWFHQGAAKVLFDFEIEDGLVAGIVFRAEPEVLGRIVKRRDGERR